MLDFPLPVGYSLYMNKNKNSQTIECPDCAFPGMEYDAEGYAGPGHYCDVCDLFVSVFV
jgi:hypothetical protein